MARILLADDQRDVLEALRILLKGEGYQTEAVTSLAGIFSCELIVPLLLPSSFGIDMLFVTACCHR